MVNLVPEPVHNCGTSCANDLQAAIAGADLRVLLMVLFQVTGEEKWLSYRQIGRAHV